MEISQYYFGQVSPDENDGAKLFAEIQRVGPIRALSSVEGPYAIVYYTTRKRRRGSRQNCNDEDRGDTEHLIYFARDPLGRRSLLLHKVK
jgi:asparagine synthetase B (glutamine-hydrolysing)